MRTANDNPKILFLDIETRPATAYVWGLFDVNVALNQLVDPGGTLCFSAKFAGERKMHFHADWTCGHRAMIEAAHALFEQADAIVTYNGDRFDLPKLHGEFLLAHLPPPAPPTSIDVYKAVKKLGLLSNKLAFVGPLLTDEGKLKHEGMDLWVKVMAGDEKAQAKMQRYCSQDVRLLERVYDRVRPYIRNHPHLHRTPPSHCGACGSGHVHVSKYRRIKNFRIQQLHCQSCGSYFDGKREAA